MVGKEGSAPGITKFDGLNYAFLKMQKEDFLYRKKMHLPLGSKLVVMKTKEWNLLDRQVLGVIHLTLSKNVAHNIAKGKTTVGMMQALVEIYQKPSTNNKVYIMKKLFN